MGRTITGQSRRSGSTTPVISVQENGDAKLQWTSCRIAAGLCGLTSCLIDEHKDALDNAKSNYDKVKKTVDELRASEDDIVLENPMKKMLLMPVEP
ncbi:structural maintenance of chromosomes protein 4 [Quercus suber]|uniref:Structural maintenance of chromosomes protein 4 n=1 Tax=Quercus suber TaxID=58331 RepID=A0AAW0M4H7_QUESU